MNSIFFTKFTTFKTFFSRSDANADNVADTEDSVENDKECKELVNECVRGDYKEPSAQIKYVRSLPQTSTSAENSKAPETTVPLEEDRKEDTSETADLTRDKAEEKNEETEIQNHEKGIFDEISE